MFSQWSINHQRKAVRIQNPNNSIPISFNIIFISKRNYRIEFLIFITQISEKNLCFFFSDRSLIFTWGLSQASKIAKQTDLLHQWKIDIQRKSFLYYLECCWCYWWPISFITTLVLTNLAWYGYNRIKTDTIDRFLIFTNFLLILDNSNQFAEYNKGQLICT